MNNLPVPRVTPLAAANTPQVFSYKQPEYGYSVLFVHYCNNNDWHNSITMKELYKKGFYQ